jgi:ectoine hydroxylase-related dioxygenase (phytanoyl-CoA dioxygenase family)
VESIAVTTPDTLSTDQIGHYRRLGFVKIPNIISKEEAASFHDVIYNFSEAKRTSGEEDPLVRDREVFTQIVNFWHEDEGIRRLTLHPNIGAVAEKLAGMPLRLWHDHMLIKQPHNKTPTEFHQDQPYWPHTNSTQSISAWVALCDVPVERGCMSFLSGSHKRTDLPAQNLSDAESFFAIAPEFRYGERVTVPLQAGDCTFHHSRCAHMATPNETDEPRVAHVIIYMDATTTFSGKKHVVTEPLKLEEGVALDGELFPPVGRFTEMQG